LSLTKVRAGDLPGGAVDDCAQVSLPHRQRLSLLGPVFVSVIGALDLAAMSDVSDQRLGNIRVDAERGQAGSDSPANVVDGPVFGLNAVCFFNAPVDFLMGIH